MHKSIVILTNFWDADVLINNKQLLINQEDKAYRINLNNKEKNYEVYSIALSRPDFNDKKNLKDISRIDCLCPTYSLLKRYKENKDWEAYEKDFTNLIKSRKEDIKDWASSLKPDFVYFLCCWENTSHGSHCHRDILYKGFKNSKVITNIIPIYRSGEFKKNKKDSKDNTILNNTIYNPSYNIDRYRLVNTTPQVYTIGFDVGTTPLDNSVPVVDANANNYTESYLSPILRSVNYTVTNGELPIIDESVDYRTDFDDI